MHMRMAVTEEGAGTALGETCARSRLLHCSKGTPMGDREQKKPRSPQMAGTGAKRECGRAGDP